MKEYVDRLLVKRSGRKRFYLRPQSAIVPAAIARVFPFSPALAILLQFLHTTGDAFKHPRKRATELRGQYI
jgi:hypothetical protein